jgi:hypothetical protein
MTRVKRCPDCGEFMWEGYCPDCLCDDPDGYWIRLEEELKKVRQRDRRPSVPRVRWERSKRSSG